MKKLKNIFSIIVFLIVLFSAYALFAKGGRCGCGGRVSSGGRSHSSGFRSSRGGGYGRHSHRPDMSTQEEKDAKSGAVAGFIISVVGSIIFYGLRRMRNYFWPSELCTHPLREHLLTARERLAMLLCSSFIFLLGLGGFHFFNIKIEPLMLVASLVVMVICLFVAWIIDASRTEHKHYEKYHLRNHKKKSQEFKKTLRKNN